jgi:hypothetical protein
MTLPLGLYFTSELGRMTLPLGLRSKGEESALIAAVPSTGRRALDRKDMVWGGGVGRLARGVLKLLLILN